MRNILFVDDERNVLDGLRRMLRPYRNEWSLHFASGGAEALQGLAQQKFDVVVSDMRMPGMNGAELLAAIRRDYPQVVRIILSGYAERDLVAQTVESAHQYLSKPCDPQRLKNTIDRACALQRVLQSKHLIAVVSQITSLPSPPKIYDQIIQELRSPETSARRVAELICQDAAMCAKMLQLVNSAFFGLPRTVSSAAQAVSLLGIEAIKNLALSVHIFTEYDAGAEAARLEALWRHSLITGMLAKAIADTQDVPRSVVDDAMTAGLLHDVGKLILLAAVPQRGAQFASNALAAESVCWETELHSLGTTHAEVGAYLLGLWGLPSNIVEAVAFHHDPLTPSPRNFDALVAVHVADGLLHEQDAAIGGANQSQLNAELLERLGLGARLDEWRELCQQLTNPGAVHV